ncbi:hypothetical protein [Gimesia maris]|uniref:hypothetical protein n=1 Tax=Gimesia maris TaxID=122 RepID=UPI0030DDAFF5|tara:strand:+ start:148 stop:489 length:342 start_codon:yes stop_codon:yes gene_type:complete
MSLKDKILKAQDTPLEEVDVPEWDTTVFIKTLTGGERLQLEKDLSKDAKTDGPALCRVVCATMCDESGKLVFNYPDDIDTLNTKSVKVLHRLFDIALKVNAMGKDDVDELAKN